MTERVLGPTGGRRRKRLAILMPFMAIAALILAIGASAGPQSTAAGFEGDDANLIVNSTFDWNGFSPTTWTGTAPYQVSTKTASGWVFNGIADAKDDSKDTVFGGGSKQDNECASVGEGPKPPNKDDLKRIYIANKTVGGKKYLALAWARIPQNTTSASAHVAFEFNQSSTNCTGSSLVTRSTANGGDMLIVYDFEGGSSTPTLKLLRWNSTGTCEASGKPAATTGPCWVFALDLTAGGFGEARVNTSDALDTIGPDGASPGDTLHSQEFGEALINLTDSLVFPANPTTCLSFGKVFGVSRSSGNSGQAQMKDLVGPADINIANCGQVIIRKQTLPDEDPNATDFTYTNNIQTLPGPTSVGNFTLKDDGVRTINDVKPGTSLYVTESDPGALYSLTSLTCTAGSTATNIVTTPLSGRTVTFDIAADQTIDCTFTNTRQKLQSSMNTAPWIYPNDKATVNANAAFTDITGSVKFRLYDSFANCDATTPSDTVDSGGLLYKQTVNLAATTGTSKEVNTSNTSVKVEADAVVYWLVEYSGDTNHFGRISDCAESIDVDLTGETGGTNVP